MSKTTHSEKARHVEQAWAVLDTTVGPPRLFGWVTIGPEIRWTRSHCDEFIQSLKDKLPMGVYRPVRVEIRVIE